MTDNPHYRWDPHTYWQNTKLVRSGQVRIYYNAGCSCGWIQQKRNGDAWYRVSDADAVTDWCAHAKGADADA